MNPAAPVTRIVFPLSSIFFSFIVYLISKVNWGKSSIRISSIPFVYFKFSQKHV